MRASGYLKKSLESLKWFSKTVYETLTGEITFKYAKIKIWSQLSLVGKRFIDGVNWKSYNKHYLEELKITAKAHTLLIKNEEVVFEDGRLLIKGSNTKPLLVSHRLLYETVIRLAPKSVLEIGCGAGDHLANLQILQKSVACFGVDLLPEQLDLLNARHPKNNFILSLADVTLKDCELPKVDLVFSHAVLMHISEKEDRFQRALDTIFLTAQKQVVLMENWTQHDFFTGIAQAIGEKSEWQLYFASSKEQPEARILIASRIKLPGFDLLEDYDGLLMGRPIVFH